MSDPSLPDPTSREPLITVGAITTAVTAVIGLLVAFGFNISGDQKATILGLLAALAPIVVGVIGRSRAYAPATVARLLAAARRGQG